MRFFSFLSSSPSIHPFPALINGQHLFMRRNCGVVKISPPPQIIPYYGPLNRHIHFINTKQKAQNTIPHLLSGHPIAMDTEGVTLGRYGKICLIQIAIQDSIYLYDTLINDLIDILEPVLSNPKILKITHDCREDASNLFHQHNITLTNVFDTQVAQLYLQELQNTPLYQISLDELLKSHLHVMESFKSTIEKKMDADTHTWFHRPLTRSHVEYASHDVMHLEALKKSLLEELEKEKEDAFSTVLQKSKKWIRYSMLNFGLKKEEIERRGANIEAMLVAKTEAAIYFKLNSSRIGVVSKEEDRQAFESHKVGDVIPCMVTNLAPNKVLYMKKNLYK